MFRRLFWLVCVLFLVGGCTVLRLPLPGAPTAVPTSTSTPLPPTSTWTPSPTVPPTPTFTPTPGWRRFGRWIPPQGRIAYYGSLSPDGAYALVVTHPQPPDAGPEAQLTDPVLHFLRMDTMEEVWRVAVQKPLRVTVVSEIDWIPGKPYVAITGLAYQTYTNALLSTDDGNIVWKKQSTYGQPATDYLAYDPSTQLLMLRNNQGIVRGYDVPSMKAKVRYTFDKTGKGCCMVDNLSTSPYGVAALGWERWTKRYNLILWENQTEGRTIRLPYVFPDITFMNLTWGPRQEIATVLLPATATSTDPWTVLFLDAQSGSVLWTITEGQAFILALTWLPGFGWMTALNTGEIRIYSGPEQYTVLATQPGWINALEALRTQPMWMGVYEDRVELWAYR